MSTAKKKPRRKTEALPGTITHRELAAKMGIGTTTIRRWMETGVIPRAHAAIGTMLFYRVTDVTTFLETGRWPEGMAYNRPTRPEEGR